MLETALDLLEAILALLEIRFNASDGKLAVLIVFGVLSSLIYVSLMINASGLISVFSSVYGLNSYFSSNLTSVLSIGKDAI